MFDKIITYSIKNKFVIGLLVAAQIVWGIYSLQQLPIDAVPDITNNQVQVITISPTLATQEIEQFITTPVEISLQNIQQLVEIRSISRFGLSVITVVFEEDMDLYLARQLVGEYLKEAQENIPEGLGSPQMAPISTGLGEIYQFVVRPEAGYEDQYSPTDLRTIQDWIVRRQLSGIEGVVEVNTMGGFLKQYEVAVKPNMLKSMGISITDVYEALENSNENTGGAYIEKNPNTYYIRTNGIAKTLSDIGNIVVTVRAGRPILIKDVATVQFGKAPRYGALTRDGREAVGGRVMMLKGANSAAVTERVKERVVQIQKSLPEGVIIEPYLVRDKLVSTAMGTVQKNLLEGGLIVVFILVLMLGNFRAGLIVASVIPLAMLFAVSMMNVLGISANLMSLGALDFGLIVDGAVIIVEAIIHALQVKFAGQTLSQKQMDKEVTIGSIKIMNASSFGMIIIMMVYIPILALVGIEGKMFRPMAQTVMLAIGGALILSLTYVPMVTALFLGKNISNKKTIADRIIEIAQRFYSPVLNLALKLKRTFVLATIALFVLSGYVFSQMGGEFIPTLDEGDLAMQMILPPGTSLSQSIETSKKMQVILLDKFPEIIDVVANIGAAEIPTDPMPVEIADMTLIMKHKSEWTSAPDRQGMFEKIEEALESIPGVGFEFSQPIQLRFNELMTGSKSDIAIKLYGDDLDLLFANAKAAEKIIQRVDGVGTVNVEQTVGMQQIVIDYKYDKLAQYGLQVRQVNRVVRTAFAGETAGVIYEGERRFDLVVRLDESERNDIESVRKMFINLANGSQVPLTEVANVKMVGAPMQISRDNTKRRIVIGINVGDSDVETLVGNLQRALDANMDLPAGYYFTYGGQFENLEAAKARLSVALPLALALIFILLFFTFGSLAQAGLIFTAIPLSAIGGIWALQLRGMPFSISAGIGFIALFGVAVLNGIVLIGYFNELRENGITDIKERIITGTKIRLRPVLMTASVASLGFLPMAISTSGGAEVQRPLATVVIGGLISATFLTLVVLPIFYSWLATYQEKNENKSGLSTASTSTMAILPIVMMFLFVPPAKSQENIRQKQAVSVEEAVEIAIQNHPAIRAANLAVTQSQKLQHLFYSLGSTEFSYEGDGLWGSNPTQTDYQFGITQELPNPAKIRAHNAMQNVVVSEAYLKQEMTVNEITLLVRQKYFELQQAQAMRSLYQRMATVYEQFYHTASIRSEKGEANKIEALTLQAALAENDLLFGQAEMKIESLSGELTLLLNTDQKVSVVDELVARSMPESDSTNSIQVQMARQNMFRSEAEVRGLKSFRWPDLFVGYAAQNYYDEGWYHGIQVGIRIPLFDRLGRRKIQARQIQVDVAKNQVEAAQVAFNQQVLTAKQLIDRYAAGVKFYQEQVNAINPEIERLTNLNYQAGEISYLELLNILNLLAQNNQRYLEQVLAYNKAVVYFQFLANL